MLTELLTESSLIVYRGDANSPIDFLVLSNLICVQQSCCETVGHVAS